jgi:RNA polymerase sigma-70 factor (ECF subfamily)
VAAAALGCAHGHERVAVAAGTANNVVRNQRRSLRRHRAALARLPANAVSATSEDETIARVDAQRTLSAALREIERLPRAQREALTPVLWSGLSYQEAAHALGIPVGTVRSRIARARAALGAALDPPTIMKEPV